MKTKTLGQISPPRLPTGVWYFGIPLPSKFVQFIAESNVCAKFEETPKHNTNIPKCPKKQ